VCEPLQNLDGNGAPERLRSRRGASRLTRMALVDLTATRLERLEKAQRETNDRLGRVEESIGGVQETLGRVVDVLEVHSRQFERMEDALIGISERVDRLTTAIVRGRTQDLGRLDDHERRLRVLERRNGRRRRKA